jgi:hypothetical protein
VTNLPLLFENPTVIEGDCVTHLIDRRSPVTHRPGRQVVTGSRSSMRTDWSVTS